MKMVASPASLSAEGSECPGIIQGIQALTAGVDVNATSEYDETPLDLARQKENWAAAQILEEAVRWETLAGGITKCANSVAYGKPRSIFV